MALQDMMSTVAAGGSLLPGIASLFSKNPAKSQSPGDAFRSEFKQRMAMGERYGISKLVMAGASPSGGWSGTVGGDSDLGSKLASMGADVSRSLAAGQSGLERRVQQLTLEKAGLENQFLREQIASVRSRTLRESAPSLPVPDRSGGRLNVAHPGLGEDAEKHYSDIGGNILGGAAFVNDIDRDVNDFFISKFGFDPRQYTPWALGDRAGNAVRNWWSPPKGSTHYKNR